MSLAHRQASLRRKRAGARRRAKNNAQVADSGRSIVHYTDKLAIALAKGNKSEQWQCAEEAVRYQHEVVMAGVMERTAQDNGGMERQLSEIEERLSGDHVEEHDREYMLARVVKMWSTARSRGGEAIALATRARILRVDCRLRRPMYSRKSGLRWRRTLIEQQGRGPDIKAKRAARVSYSCKSVTRRLTTKRIPASSSRRSGDAKLRGGGTGLEQGCQKGTLEVSDV